MAFFQTPPQLQDPFEQDSLLRSYLTRVLPDDARREIEPTLREVSALSASMFTRTVAEQDDEPRLVSWDAWGKRIDRIDLTPMWRDAARITAEKGIVATAYERRHGALSRVHQFALVHLIDPAWHVYSCPLAMTDGAARSLITAKNKALVDHAVPRLISRNPDRAWTSGQWMTERTGGSDVAISETIAKRDGDRWRLFGTKWFTSATTSQMALTLARPEGNPPGSSGLALFYVETRDAQGSLNGIQINRLKDKLGTRMVPTAELTLDGTLATAVIGDRDGVKHITPMLAVTRTWNSVCAASGMRRALMLSSDYSKRRIAFGAPLAEKPLHRETLAGIEAEAAGAFLIAFRSVELLGKDEADTISDHERALMRLLVPMTKLVTGKQAVAVTSEVLESFGGAGYVEDTGLPRLLRDAQVLPIWEGTTNVLSLDVLRALGKGGGLEPLDRELDRCLQHAHVSLRESAEIARRALTHAKSWIAARMEKRALVEAGARRFALTLGRAIELALLIDHATWALDHNDKKWAAAARIFSRSAIDSIMDDDITFTDANDLLS